MKEYVRRVKATVEASWLDEGEGAGLEAVAEEGAAPAAGAAQGENAAAAGQATA
jgi:ubiquitin-conjugating enzyme E2 A